MGVEPLSRDFTAQYLWTKAQGKKCPIKAFLMDGKNVTGVGNIYASEALFVARIHPMLPATSVSKERFHELVKAVKKILRAAICAGGTTLKDFMGSDGKPGYFVQELKVYGRYAKPCVHCHTLLEAIVISQRRTFFCPHCQI